MSLLRTTLEVVVALSAFGGLGLAMFERIDRKRTERRLFDAAVNETVCETLAPISLLKAGSNNQESSKGAGSFHCGNEGSIRPLATSPEQRVALETPLLAAWLWEATNPQATWTVHDRLLPLSKENSQQISADDSAIVPLVVCPRLRQGAHHFQSQSPDERCRT